MPSLSLRYIRLKPIAQRLFPPSNLSASAVPALRPSAVTSRSETVKSNSQADALDQQAALRNENRLHVSDACRPDSLHRKDRPPQEAVLIGVFLGFTIWLLL